MRLCRAFSQYPRTQPPVQPTTGLGKGSWLAPSPLSGLIRFASSALREAGARKDIPFPHGGPAPPLRVPPCPLSPRGSSRTTPQGGSLDSGWKLPSADTMPAPTTHKNEQNIFQFNNFNTIAYFHSKLTTHDTLKYLSDGVISFIDPDREEVGDCHGIREREVGRAPLGGRCWLRRTRRASSAGLSLASPFQSLSPGILPDSQAGGLNPAPI